MKSLYKNEQSGRSMVEMLGVLAIIGVLSIGGISGYSKAMAKYRVNKTLDQISMLVINIRTLFSSSINYDGLSDANAISLGIIPGDMQNGTNIINSYQGSVLLGNPGTSDDAKRRFYITYTGLNSEACVSLATADWGSQSGSGLNAIAVQPGDATAPEEVCTKSVPSAAGDTGCFVIGDNIPISLGDAVKSCSSGTGDKKTDKFSITWFYY